MTGVSSPLPHQNPSIPATYSPRQCGSHPPFPQNGGGTDQAAAPPLLPIAPAAPAFAFAPRGRDPEPARGTAQPSAKTGAKTGASPIAVVSLLLGRRRASRHWLIAAHGDPAGLAARLQGRLVPVAPSDGAASPAQVGLGGGESPWPTKSASTTTSSKAGAVPRAESGPDCLWQRAFSDCTALTKPDPPSEASYRYRLSLPSGRLASASVACWRRYSPGGPWQRRCGPMTLATFLRHYGSPPERPEQVRLY